MAQPDDINLSVIARSLAYLAYKANTDLVDAELAEKAMFVMGLGLAREEAAALLGSTDESLRKSLERAKKGGKKRARKSSK